MEQEGPLALLPVDKPLNLVPVGLKEAALDSPTFRATALHFGDQVDLIERWLDSYVRSGTKLAHDVAALEASVNAMMQTSQPPDNVSEAILDHDYTLLATRRFGEAAGEFWNTTFKAIKRSESNVIDPIRHFTNGDLRSFKETRRTLEAAQRSYDAVLSRYSGQPKSKEASSLREDAFQLHEARKAYLKASMDFCVQGPQIRASLDKLLVRVFSDQWKDFRNARDANTIQFTKWDPEMDRIRGWGRELENSERAFKRELQIARRQLEDTAEHAARPSRELDDYAEKTAPYQGSNAPSTQRAEKQGWLYLKSVTGKPTRTLWSRRWFFVKNGIFGWLVQGHRSGGVEESEKIGVLLCSTRPASQEERRFCFEVKTKDTTIILQAETQLELSQWIESFELAKRKALQDPGSTESSGNASNMDAAFAISPPVAPELAAKGNGHLNHGSEDIGTGIGPHESNIASRSSIDVSSSRRSTVVDRDPDAGLGRHTTARIMQKLDLHKRSGPSGQMNSSGGIASLIAASHNVLPVGPGNAATASTSQRSFTMPASTLAPSTMANPPAPTNLSKTAVVISGERGVGIGQSGGSGMPSGIMANLWGSEKWGAVNRLERDDARSTSLTVSQKASPDLRGSEFKTTDDVGVMDGEGGQNKEFGTGAGSTNTKIAHRSTISMGSDSLAKVAPWTVEDYPNYYPASLKAQDAQFRILFPDVPRAEKVVLVFRATWNPNDHQEFPGRIYVTAREIYFYSHHLGFILVSGVSLETVTEITAAPGRDCDFLFVHLKDDNRPDDIRRITIKTFLEPLKLLQKRLDFLRQNANSETPVKLEQVVKTLLRFEIQETNSCGDNDSWDDLGDEADGVNQARGRAHDIKPSLRIDHNLYGDPVARTGREVTRFKLPSQAVVYNPQGFGTPTAVRDFSTSAKALYHVVFGDKSAIFQMLYQNRTTDGITQSPWLLLDEKRLGRTFTCPFNSTTFTDAQTIDIANDHLCYVVTSTMMPVNLPWAEQCSITTKYVITHSSKSQCRFAVFHKVTWTTTTRLVRSRKLVTLRAERDQEHDAEDLMKLAMEQVVKLGSFSKTSKATQVFGAVGQSTQSLQISAADLPPSTLPSRKLRTWTLFGLYRHEGLKSILKVVTLVFDLLIAVVKSLMSVASAHTLLVVLLATSGLYNSFHTYRDGVQWYHDRNAANFMARLGVQPNAKVSRGVYLRDVEDLVGLPAIGNYTDSTNVEQSTCRSTFSDLLIASADDEDNAGSRSVAKLSKTRASLAQYRHDLLVGLRVVNRVENEVVSAEWEDWVKAESRKCGIMRGMLHQNDSEEEGEGEEAAGMEVVTELDRYCDSCSREVEVFRNMKGRSKL